jgi:hypothetical protein
MQTKLVFCKVQIKIFLLCSLIPSSSEDVAGIVTSTGWTAEECLFETRQGQEVYIFFTAPRAERGPRVESGGGEWGVDHSPPFTTQLKNEWSSSSTHTYTFVLREGDILSL